MDAMGGTRGSKIAKSVCSVDDCQRYTIRGGMQRGIWSRTWILEAYIPLGLDNPAGSSPGDAYPRHILDSINTSTDLQKKKTVSATP